MSEPSSLIGCLFGHAQLGPERCAVAGLDLRLSYGELAQCVLAQAVSLEKAGVAASSVVGIECDDDAQHLLLCLATVYLGATSCTIPTFGSPEERQRVMQSAGVTHVAGKDLALDLTQRGDWGRELSQSGAAHVHAELLFSTSGTTGEAKIVRHSDAGLVSQAHRHITSPDERFACLATLEHNFAKRHRLYCVARGATNVFLKQGLEQLVEQCRALETTTLHVSAFQAQELLAVSNIADLPRMRLKLGGSHVPAGLRRKLREIVSNDLQCGYGTTETGAIGFTEASDEDALESVGRALPGIEIRLADKNRKGVAPGEHGEVAIRCEGMFLGYLNQAELTESRLADGWFYTGDIGYLDDEKQLHLCGRADDMFVFNSINIYPQDIEAQICRYPTVVDAAVLPKSSPVHGDIPVALVVLKGLDAPDMRDLKKFVRSHVGLRCPRQFTIVERIPRNAGGKIIRAEAQTLFAQASNG